MASYLKVWKSQAMISINQCCVCLNLRKLIIFMSVKFYCLITLISHVAQLLLIHKFYCFRPYPHISFKYVPHNHYVAQLWGWGSISQNVASLNILAHDVKLIVNKYIRVSYWKLKQQIQNPQNINISFSFPITFAGKDNTVIVF